jgi:protocatechuate 3,4-dioxygenase beta subunit
MAMSKSRFIPVLGFLFFVLIVAGLLAFFLQTPEDDTELGKNYQKPARTVKRAAKVKLGRASAIEKSTRKKAPKSSARKLDKAPMIDSSGGPEFTVRTGQEGRRTVKKRAQPGVSEAPVAVKQKTGLRGRVVNSQKSPIANAKISVQGRRKLSGIAHTMGHFPGASKNKKGAGPGTSTDADGRFELKGLDPGQSYTVHIEAGAGYMETSHRVPTLRPSEIVNGGDFLVEKAGRISGIVVDPAGQPVAGARVRLQTARSSEQFSFLGDEDDDEEGGGGKKVVRRAIIIAESDENGSITTFSNGIEGKRTDEEGRFTFDNLKPEKYTVRGSKKGFRRAQVANIGVAESQHVQNVRLALTVAGKITVLVKNADGQAVSGASVQVTAGMRFLIGGMLNGRKAGVKTDNNGYAHFEKLGQTRYNVIANADGYAEGTVKVEFNKGQEEITTEITLKEGIRLVGRLLKGEDQTALGAAAIYLRAVARPGTRNLRPSMPVIVTTDKEGRFKSKALNPGTYDVTFQSRGLRTEVKRVALTLENPIHDFGDINLRPLLDLEVRVLDGQGKPVEGATVRVNQGPMGYTASRKKSNDGEEVELEITIGDGMSSKTTNEHGVAVLNNSAPGLVSVQVQKDGYPDGFLEDIAISEDRGPARVVVHLTGSGRIEGSVVKNDQSRAGGVTVFLFRKGHRWPVATVKSDADGVYTFAKVATGSYILRVQNMLPLSKAETKFLELRGNETLREDLTLARSDGNK